MPARSITLRLALALTAGTILTASAVAQTPPTPETAVADSLKTEAAIDAVFVLDTTGSMSGLIEGAKQKIWSIANQIATAKPRPKIRIGLVAYRDRGDEYITQVTDLSEDLDAIYSDLMKFAAGGGGDSPESVNQGLNEAITRIKWTPGKDALKLIYLVGDCPPHMDYQDDVKYPQSCELAAKAGIIVNTIQCGNQSDTTPIWQEIARLAEGQFFQIEQSGGMVAIATPYDAELAKYGAALNDTIVPWGSHQQQLSQSARIDKAKDLDSAAAPAANAERAIYKSSAAGLASLSGAGENELIADLKNGRVKLESLKDEELPGELQKLKPEERAAWVEKKSAEREAAQKEINELSQKRQKFIQEKLAEQSGKPSSFDALVLKALREQAARKGIRYAE